MKKDNYKRNAVDLYTKSGEFLKTFDSMSDCDKAIGASTGVVGRSLKSNSFYRNWRFALSGEKLQTKEEIKINLLYAKIEDLGFNLNDLEKFLIKYEGYNKKLYYCENILHFGFGHNVESNMLNNTQFKVIVNGTDKSKLNLALRLLKNDISNAENQLSNKCTSVFKKCNNKRKDVLIKMVFQMGIGSFLGFKEMIKAITSEDWEKAKIEGLDSLWGRKFNERATETVKNLL